jgi:hypothetical protein
MAIRIPDNLMNRPYVPGGVSDGTENVTRAFGNRTEQFASFQDVQRGFGGVANESAGLENRAAAQAAEQVNASVQDTMQYIENIKLADEDSRQKSMFLKAEAAALELRKKLREDPNLAKQSEDVQQAAYEIQRDVMLDKLVQSESFSQPKIKKLIKQNVAQFRVQDSTDYNQRVLIPQMVEARKQRDGEDVASIVGTAMVAQSPESTAKAVGLIQQRYRTPEAYATYGAVNAQAFEANALAQLKKGLVDASLKRADDVMADAPKKHGLQGLLTNDALNDGPMALQIADELLKLELNLVNAGATEGERLIARENYQKTLQQAGRASIATHNQVWKAAEAEKKEQNYSLITAFGDSLFIRASSGGASDAVINKAAAQTLRALGIDPVAAAEGKLTDPAQVDLHHRVITQIARINGEQKSFEREQRRLASERLTRQAITELRVDNGIAISSASADSLWQRTGVLKSFIDGGNVLNDTHLQAIEKAGAVPTSVLGSIQQDLRSSNPQVQARGVANLRAIKSHSSKTQGALYRDLPDDFAGVINRLDNGWSITDSLNFLQRPRNAPDVEKKLKTEARKAANLATANEVLKEAELPISNMSALQRDNLHSQWEDSFARAGGDVKLARDLFKQDVAKNKNIGVSDFTGKVEQFPITKFAPKQVITEIINENFPETKDKEVIPVFSGLKRQGSSEIPTYDIYVKEDGVLTRVTSENKQFYTTAEEVAGIYEKKNKAKVDAAVAKALERKAQTQATLDALAAREAALRQQNANRAAAKFARTQGN